MIRRVFQYLLFGENIMARLEELEREIGEMKATAAAAAETIRGLAERITACECDPEKLAALVADLDATQNSLQAVVDAHADQPEPDQPEDE